MGKNKSLPAVITALTVLLAAGFMAIAFSAAGDVSRGTGISTGTADSPSMMTAEQRFPRRGDSGPRLFVSRAVQKIMPCYQDSCVPRGIIVIAGIVFIGLVMAPFLFGLKELSSPRDSMTPFIDPAHTRDGRYFDRSFWKKLDAALGGDYTPGTRKVTLSKPETVEVSGPLTVADGGTRSSILYVSGSLNAGSRTVFNKEICATGAAVFGPESALRAAAAGGDITLGDGTRVVRWTGAEGNMAIGERCRLGARALCEGTMTIGRGCSFRYLYGAPIRVYADPLFKERKAAPPEERTIQESAWHFRPRAVSVPPFTAVEKDIIVEGSISIKRGCAVKGSIKAYGSILLGEGVTVDGDLFAEEVIDIGERCVIRGNVFSQGKVFVSGGTAVGAPGKTKTVTGKDEVQIFHDCVVYGHVITQGEGTVV